MAFGAAHGTAIFQRVTDAIRRIMQASGIQIWNYIDDLFAFVPADQADAAFELLRDLVLELGLPINYSKLVPPTTFRISDKITRQFWSFLVAHDMTDSHAVAPLLAYTQYLADQGLSFRTIMNYMSALRSNLSRLNQPVQSFDHSVYKAFLKSLSHRKPTTIIPNGFDSE